MEDLRQRIAEFGEKPLYVLFPSELEAGKEYGLLDIQEPEDCGDGTIITRTFFEGKKLVCVTQKE